MMADSDSWVIRHGEYYYLAQSTNDNITIRQSQSLT